MPTVDGAPLIANIDSDLMTRQEVAHHFKVSVGTIDKWRYGREGKPRIPYFRLGHDIYFSRTQLVWWLNEYQKQVDPIYEERMRRLKEGIQVGRPRTRNKPV